MKELELIGEIIKVVDNRKTEDVDKILESIRLSYGSGLLFLKSDNKSLTKLSKKSSKIFELINNLMHQILSVDHLPKPYKVSSCNQLLEYLKYTYMDCEREIFKVIYLDAKNMVIEEENMFYGTIDKSSVHVREIMKKGLRCNAKGIILVHNHPSGNTTPSESDVYLTVKVKEIAKYFEIELLDHLILSNLGYYSFCEEGKI